MKKGFTIIELLVVVAIIGILSAVVMFFVSEPGAKASDNAVKANLLAIRKQSEIYYLTQNSYGTNTNSCKNQSPTNVFDDTTVQSALTEVTRNLGGARTVTCQVSGDGLSWATYVDSLKNGDKWCVDSSGFSGVPTGEISNGKCQ